MKQRQADVTLPQPGEKADVKLTLDAKSGAAANGSEKNKVTATLSSEGNLLSGKNVSFMVTGSAYFDNDLQLTSATTSAFGEAVVRLKDKKSETVTVTAVYESTKAEAESTFGDGGTGGGDGDGDRDITVTLQHNKFNLFNICGDYNFVAGKTYQIDFPSALGPLGHYTVIDGYHFDPNTGHTPHGPADYEGDGPVTGNIYDDTFVANKSGVLEYFTSQRYFFRKGNPGTYVFHFRVV